MNDARDASTAHGADEGLTVEKVVEVLDGATWVMLTTALADGKLLSHPMGIQETTPEADMYFIINTTTDQAIALRDAPQVNVSVAEAGSWLSVAGTAAFVEDRAKVRELWSDALEAYFEGPDDPAIGLLRVSSESAQYWGVPGGKVAALAEIVKTRLTGGRPAGGTETVEL